MSCEIGDILRREFELAAKESARYDASQKGRLWMAEQRKESERLQKLNAEARGEVLYNAGDFAEIQSGLKALSVVFFWAPSKSIALIQTMRWRSSSGGSRLGQDCTS
jgi:hypothetical protein